MALGTSKLDELYLLIPEEARKTSIQYTIKIGKEVVYKGDLRVNSKVNQLGDSDLDAIMAAIAGDTRKGQAITITGSVGKAAEKLFYRDSKGAIKVNSFESLIEEEKEIDAFPEEEAVLTSEEMQEALNAFGYEEPVEPELNEFGRESDQNEALADLVLNGGYQEALDAFGYEPEGIDPPEVEPEIENSAEELSSAELNTLELEGAILSPPQSTAESLASRIPSEVLPSAVTVYNNQMIAVGRGKYPYECEEKDKHPDAMIYYGDAVWDTERSQGFQNRNQALDEFEPIADLTFEQIREYQDGLSLERIKAEREAKAALEIPVAEQVEAALDETQPEEVDSEPELESLRSLTVDDFMEGQCFNFALALGQNLSGDLKPESLVTITSFREEEDSEVCIHCVVKARTPDNTVVCLDAEGIHAEDYADDRADKWEQFEYEIAQEQGRETPSRNVVIDEFNLDADGISQYWATLIDTNAQFDLAVVTAATQYIADNQNLFALPEIAAAVGEKPDQEIGNINESFLHVQKSTVPGVKDGGLVGPFDSMESAVDFRQDNLTNPKVSIGSVYAGSFFKIEAVENAIAPEALAAAIEPEVEPVKPTPSRFSLKGLGQAIQGKAKAVAQQVQENVQAHITSSRDKLPASAIALLELHDSKLKDPALAWIGRKLEQAKPELISLREQVQKVGVEAARKGLQAVANVPSAVLDQAVSSCVVNVMDKLGSETLINGAQHYLTENYVMSRQGNHYQVNDSNGKELLTFTQEKISRNVSMNNLDKLQVSQLLKADKQVTLMPDKPTLTDKVSLGNFAPLGSRERAARNQEQQISTILKAAIAVQGQEQPNGDRVFEGGTFYAKQSGDTIQLSRKVDADVIFAIDTTSKRADTNHLDSTEVAQILKFGAALEQAVQAQAVQKTAVATR